MVQAEVLTVFDARRCRQGSADSTYESLLRLVQKDTRFPSKVRGMSGGCKFEAFGFRRASEAGEKLAKWVAAAAVVHHTCEAWCEVYAAPFETPSALQHPDTMRNLLVAVSRTFPGTRLFVLAPMKKTLPFHAAHSNESFTIIHDDDLVVTAPSWITALYQQRYFGGEIAVVKAGGGAASSREVVLLRGVQEDVRLLHLMSAVAEEGCSLDDHWRAQIVRFMSREWAKDVDIVEQLSKQHNTLCLVAVSCTKLDVKLVGFLVAVFHCGVRALEVPYVLVSEEYRSRGIAQSLLRTATVLARGRHIAFCFAACVPRSVPFWKRNKFSHVSEFKMPSSPERDSIPPLLHHMKQCGTEKNFGDVDFVVATKPTAAASGKNGVYCCYLPVSLLRNSAQNVFECSKRGDVYSVSFKGAADNVLARFGVRRDVGLVVQAEFLVLPFSAVAWWMFCSKALTELRCTISVHVSTECTVAWGRYKETAALAEALPGSCPSSVPPLLRKGCDAGRVEYAGEVQAPPPKVSVRRSDPTLLDIAVAVKRRRIATKSNPNDVRTDATHNAPNATMQPNEGRPPPTIAELV